MNVSKGNKASIVLNAIAKNLIKVTSFVKFRNISVFIPETGREVNLGVRGRFFKGVRPGLIRNQWLASGISLHRKETN